MVPAAYDAIADWYDSTVRSGANSFSVLPLLHLLDDVRGHVVCDLATGQGVVARHLAQRGAEVLGVDLSANLLALARRDDQGGPGGIPYVQADAQGRLPLLDGRLDGVTCNMALADIEDLLATLHSIARALRPGGWFVFSVTHPCFQTPEACWEIDLENRPSLRVRGYFREMFWRSDNPDGVRGRVGAYHRTLSTYVNALHDAGLVVERLSEPLPDRDRATRLPGTTEVPTLLLAKCRRIE